MSHDEPTRELGQALAASVTVGLVTWVTFDAFSNPMASGTLFLLVGCCGALWRLQVEQHAPHRLRPTGGTTVPSPQCPRPLLALPADHRPDRGGVPEG